MAKTYREIYEDKWGNIKEGYDIHHIDGNHDNNDPRNLVAIPKKLHIKYHALCKQIPDCINVNKKIEIYGSGYLFYITDLLSEFANIKKECAKYLMIRDGYIRDSVESGE